MGRLLQKSETVRLEGAPARVAIVADTHSKPHPALIEQLSAIRPCAILHAGDIGELTVLDELSRVAPVYAVRGNIDVQVPSLPDALTLDLVAGEERLLRLLVLHIAVAGPRLRSDAARLARQEGASLVVCGHSHVPFLAKERGLTVFNPGSIGPRRFQLPIVFGIMDVAADGARFAHVDVETGKQWLPPRLSV
jgi:uncharacterized protein